MTDFLIEGEWCRNWTFAVVVKAKLSERLQQNLDLNEKVNGILTSAKSLNTANILFAMRDPLRRQDVRREIRSTGLAVVPFKALLYLLNENFFNENKHSDFVQLITQIFALSCRHDFAKLTSTEQCDSHLNVKLLRVIRPKKLESACIENKQDLNRTKWVCL